MATGLGTVAGALLSAGYALHPVWWAAWLAPAVLLLAASGGTHRGTPSLAAAVAGAVALASVLPYYVAQNGWAITLGIAVLRVGTWVLAARLTVAAARRVPLGVAMLVLPGVIAAAELLTLTLSPHGAVGSLAYSQMDAPAVVQVASLGGVPAVVFLVLLPGSLAGVWRARPWPAGQRAAALASLAVLGAGAAVFAQTRFRAAACGPRVPVALVATNRFADIPEAWDTVWAAYAPAVARAAPAGGLVVLPEKLALLDAAAADRAAAEVSAAARATGATVLAGLEVRDAAPGRGRDGRRDRVRYRNRALVATPDGGVTWYDKQRLVPGWEARDTPGDAPLVVGAAGTALGVAICKDMHVPAVARAFAWVSAARARRLRLADPELGVLIEGLAGPSGFGGTPPNEAPWGERR